MRWLNKKTPGFTIAEILVVLAIGVIVTGLGFTVLGMLKKNIAGYSNGLNQKSELVLLNGQIAKDFYGFPSIKTDGYGNLKFSSRLDSITYRVEGAYLFRELDTLTPIKTVAYYYLGEKIDFGPVDAMAITLKEEDSLPGIFVYKRNDGLTMAENGN